MVFSGFGREKEIGLAIVRADPLAIHSYAHRGGRHLVGQEIHQGFWSSGRPTGCFESSVFTSNNTRLGPQPAAVRDAAAWSCAMAGNTAAKNAKKTTSNCFRARASVIRAHE
jgi:hypothetical protein